jgi:hypothetical protein
LVVNIQIIGGGMVNPTFNVTIIGPDQQDKKRKREEEGDEGENKKAKQTE